MLEPAALPAVLRLEPLGDHVYGAPQEQAGDDVVRNVIFGGQILAQMIVAAALDGAGADGRGAAREKGAAPDSAVPEKEVESIHAVFARAGDYHVPLRYVVDPMHDGRTLASESVTAEQEGRVISRGLVLRSLDEPDLIHHANVTMPDVPGPDDPAGRPDGRVFPGAEARICGGVNTWSDDEPVRPAVQHVWTRYPGSFESPIVHQAVLAWATDGFLIGTAMLPHAGYHEGQAHRTISTGVVSHTINFHERFDVSDWLLVSNESVWAGRGRTYGRAHVFTREGTLVASYTQDAIVRAFGDGRDHSADYGRIM